MTFKEAYVFEFMEDIKAREKYFGALHLCSLMMLPMLQILWCSAKLCQSFEL